MIYRGRAGIVAVAASAALGCTRHPSPQVVEHRARSAPAAWQVAWTSPIVTCDQEWSPPDLARDGDALVDVCARYELATGIATRSAGTRLTAPAAGDSTATHVLSRDGTRELAIEPVDEASETLQVTELPSSRVVCTRRFQNPIHPHSAASLADGRLVVFAQQRCRPVARDLDGNAPALECAEHGLFAVANDCSLEAVMDDVALRDAVVTPDGRAAVVVRRDGHGQFVRLPVGTPIADLPVIPVDLARHTRPESMSVTDSGAVAVAGDLGAAVFVRDGEHYASVYATNDPSAARTLFLPDRKAVVFSGIEKITLIRSATP